MSWGNTNLINSISLLSKLPEVIIPALYPFYICLDMRHMPISYLFPAKNQSSTSQYPNWTGMKVFLKTCQIPNSIVRTRKEKESDTTTKKWVCSEVDTRPCLFFGGEFLHHGYFRKTSSTITWYNSCTAGWMVSGQETIFCWVPVP